MISPSVEEGVGLFPYMGFLGMRGPKGYVQWQVIIRVEKVTGFCHTPTVLSGITPWAKTPLSPSHRMPPPVPLAHGQIEVYPVNLPLFILVQDFINIQFIAFRFVLFPQVIFSSVSSISLSHFIAFFRWSYLFYHSGRQAG